MKDYSNIKYFKNENTYENFKQYKNMLIDCNNKFNITSIVDEDEIFVKHFLDSLMGENKIPQNAKVIEIGSGGGFPSVPLKLYRDDLKFTLCEATNKKCGFLNEIKNTFNFQNFEVLNARCEDLAKNEEYREKFDVCVARAVASLNTLCEYMLPFVKVGGIMLAYKGDCEEEIKLAQNAISILGGKLKETESYDLEDNYGKRTLVIIEKIKNTPQKYPRGNGKERSKPL